MRRFANWTKNDALTGVNHNALGRAHCIVLVEVDDPRLVAIDTIDRNHQRGDDRFLVGVTNPSLVMPESVIRNASEQDIAVVMAHELMHYQRRDTWTGWLQVIALSLLWFHPVFWWAMRQRRQSREEACDESVLRKTLIGAEDYGEAMLRLVTKPQAKLLDGVGLVGEFERSSQIQVTFDRDLSTGMSWTGGSPHIHPAAIPKLVGLTSEIVNCR